MIKSFLDFPLLDIICQVYLLEKKMPSRNLNPSECHDNYWLYCYEKNLARSFHHSDGKWMMFFPLGSTLDYYWKAACELYRSGKLIGINSMKVSTARRNPLAIYANGMGMIIFYCGESEDQETVMTYGQNILNHIYYPDNFFYFKSDKNYLINERNVYKHLYYINTFNFYNYNQKTLQNYETKNINTSYMPKPMKTSFIDSDQDSLSMDEDYDVSFNNLPLYKRFSFRSDSRSKSRESIRREERIY